MHVKWLNPDRLPLIVQPSWTSSVCLFIGINLVKRKLAAHDNLKITLKQDGNTFHVKEVSNFRTLEMDFTLGVTFEYSLADGTELSVSKSSIWQERF